MYHNINQMEKINYSEFLTSRDKVGARALEVLNVLKKINPKYFCYDNEEFLRFEFWKTSIHCYFLSQEENWATTEVLHRIDSEYLNMSDIGIINHYVDYIKNKNISNLNYVLDNIEKIKINLVDSI